MEVSLISSFSSRNFFLHPTDCILSRLMRVISLALIAQSMGDELSFIQCPLVITGDQLLALTITNGLTGSEEQVRDLIVDSGSEHNAIFDSSAPMTPAHRGSLRFQGGLNVEEMGVNDGYFGTVKCEPYLDIMKGEFVIGSPSSTGGVPLQGTIGLGQDVLVNPKNFLWRRFEQLAAVSVAIPLSLQPGFPGEARLTVFGDTSAPGYNGPFMKVNSSRYWSSRVIKLIVGGTTIGDNRGISVVFDTGSNYFGATTGIYDDLKKAACGSKIEVITPAFSRDSTRPLDSPFYLTFPFKNDGPEDCDTFVEALNPEGFGEISGDEVLIIGTLGMRGKTLSIYPIENPPKRGEFFVSIRDN